MNVGHAIRWCRTRRGVSQGDVAKEAQCSVSYLSMLENNKRDPTLSTITKIAAALHVPVGALFVLASDQTELGAFDKSIAEDVCRAATLTTSDDKSLGVAHG